MGFRNMQEKLQKVWSLDRILVCIIFRIIVALHSTYVPFKQQGLLTFKERH